MMPSLDMPHHLRSDEWCQYREGVALSTIALEKGKKGRRQVSTLIDTGLPSYKYDVKVSQEIPDGTRVTVKFSTEEDALQVGQEQKPTVLGADAVAPSEPREEGGLYWGYNVRVAESLSAVLTECPFDGGYDLTFGTSERGKPIADIQKGGPNTDAVPKFDHMMIVIGGVAGLEAALKADGELKQLGVKNPETLFDFWVNLVPGQGSRTIRTEEAVWLGLAAIRDIALAKGQN